MQKIGGVLVAGAGMSYSVRVREGDDGAEIICPRCGAKQRETRGFHEGGEYGCKCGAELRPYEEHAETELVREQSRAAGHLYPTRHWKITGRGDMS